MAAGSVHVLRVAGWNANDIAWLTDVRRGLVHVWSEPGPFGDWRPLFGTWLWLVDHLGLSTPPGLAAAGLVLWWITGAILVVALRPVFDSKSAWLAGALLLVHPGRHEHLFWISAQTDALWVLFGLLALSSCTRDRPRGVSLWGTFVASALAASTKEAAALVVLLVALYPGRPRPRASVFAAALGVGLVSLVRLSVVEPSRYLDVARTAVGHIHKVILFPSRLTLPIDFSRVGDLRGGDPVRITVLALGTLSAILLLVSIWRRRAEPSARAAIVLILGGGLAWLITPQERSVGIGACGAAVALAVMAAAGEAPRWVRTLLVGLVAFGWPPLWLARERQWIDAQRIGREVAVAARAWRHEVGPRRFLIALSTPVSVRGAVTPTLWEVDPCAIELAQIGAVDAGARPRVEPRSRGRFDIVLPANGIFARSDCSDAIGVACERRRWAHRATLDPARLAAAFARPAECGATDVRWWDGTAFRPPPE